MLKMLKLLKDKLNNFVQQQIIRRYNNIVMVNKNANYEDAAFLFFLDCILIFSYTLFLMFASLSMYFFIRYEIMSSF